MKTGKRILSIFLAVLMLVTSAPLGAFAGNKPNTALHSDSNFGSSNAFDIIANNITSAEENEDYQISYVSVKGNTATVDFSNAAACLLVVAVYDENTMQLLGSGMKEVETEHLEEDVEIDISSMPSHFVTKAFLLDENYAALSNQYVNYENTTKYEQFLEKKPEDFDENQVLVFDNEKEEPDFAVLTEDAVSSDFNPSMMFSYNEDTATYVFKNATSDVRNLKAGDIFHYEYGSKANEFLLFKVKTISVSGSTVTIVEDTDIGLEDVFSFVRIDSEGDYSDISIDESQLGAALVLEDDPSSPRMSPAKSDPDLNYDESNSWGTTFNLKWNIWNNGTQGREDDLDDSWLRASINGTLGYSFSTSVRLIYDVVLFGKDYYEFKSETKHEVKLIGFNVTGTMVLPEDIVRIPIPEIPVGPFSLKITIAPVAELSISINFDVTYTYKTVITADRANGMQKTKEATSDWDASLDDKIEIKFGLVISFTLKFCQVVSLKLEGKGGIKYTGSTTTIGAWTDHLHNCRFCLYGDVNGFIDVKLTLKIKIIPDILDFSWDMIKWGHEWYITDLHFSLGTNGQWSIGNGECPNILHKVTFVVFAMENGAKKMLENATVTASTGVCDNENDGKWNDHSTATNEEGEAVFYFPAGEHSATAECDTYTTNTGDFKIISNAKQVEIELQKAVNGAPEFDYSSMGAADGIGSADDLSAGGTQGGIIQFGAYPQTEVTDSATISALDSRASDWQSFGYYSGTDNSYDGQMQPSNYMQYCDVKYGGNKYRGVTFSQLRPYYTHLTSSENNSYQDDNGYTLETIYWFKYEPLQWKVLDPSEGLVMCVSLIDSQPFNNYVLKSERDPHGSVAIWCDAGRNHYANDYANSSLRKWLNDVFYATAFTESQQNRIAVNLNQNNNGYYTLTGNTNFTDYDSVPTNDKIFLLSYDEVLNSSYGFSSSYSTYDTARQAKETDYAECQGLLVNNDGISGCNLWWLRSPGNENWCACFGTNNGQVWYTYYVHFTGCGVRPVCVISNLSSENAKSSSPNRRSASTAKAAAAGVGTYRKTDTGAFQYTATGCVAGQDYILLNVTGFGDSFTLTTNNLEYIDQVTADESGAVSGAFLPRQAVAGSTTLLIGDFGSGNDVVILAEEAPPTTHTHTYTSSVTKQPTCTKAGVRTYTCTSCATGTEGHTYSEKINPLGHAYINHAAKEPSCEEPGWNAYQTCSRCSYTTFAEKEALGHIDEDEDGYCDREDCGEPMEGADLCPYCGKVHKGFFQKIIGFFHKIIYKLTNLFKKDDIDAKVK